MATVLSPESTGFRAARTVEEALETLAELGEEATILAGGTDVMAQFLSGEITPGCLLHIGRVDELATHEATDSRVSLGALVSHRTVATHSTLSPKLPALAEACATVGGWQTQEVGTVVGNVCNASPAADTLPPLLVAGTRVRVRSSSDERALPLAEFVTGRRATAARPDELVIGLDLEPIGPGSGEVYLKVAPRTAMEVAVVALAVRLHFEDGRVTDARIAAGAVAPVPFRAPDAEAVLVESGLSPEGVDEAARLLAGATDPIDDARASASYRRTVTRRLLRRAVDIATARAEGS
jgi:aerobic carbon-monoxide dehydrogenase medium subunit